jgi:glycosyl transferase family 25
MHLLTYVLNLDRHEERLAAVKARLDAQGVEWIRFSAIDANTIDPHALDQMVARSGPIPRMPVTARACTAGHIQIVKAFLETDATHALVLEDDAVFSPHFARDLPKIVEGMGGGLINISRQIPSGSAKRLLVKTAGAKAVSNYLMPELVGIHYSGAGYLMDRNAAKTILALFPYPDMPIDHILFNPNVSRLGRKIPVRQLFPALVKPRENLASSIQTTEVAGAKSIKNQLKRAKAEISIVPRLLLGLLFKRYEIRTLDFYE